MAERDDIYKRLLNEDPEFRIWNEEHRRYESRLQILASKASLSPDEELEEKTLKKRKLHLKDRMAQKLSGLQVAQRA